MRYLLGMLRVLWEGKSIRVGVMTVFKCWIWAGGGGGIGSLLWQRWPGNFWWCKQVLSFLLFYSGCGAEVFLAFLSVVLFSSWLLTGQTGKFPPPAVDVWNTKGDKKKETKSKSLNRKTGISALYPAIGFKSDVKTIWMHISLPTSILYVF